MVISGYKIFTELILRKPEARSSNKRNMNNKSIESLLNIWYLRTHKTQATVCIKI